MQKITNICLNSFNILFEIIFAFCLWGIIAHSLIYILAMITLNMGLYEKISEKLIELRLSR